MTLTEILIVIVILGVIVSPIVGAIVITLRNTSDTRTRMVQSHHANLVSTYLNEDAASATTAVANSGTTCSGVGNKLGLSWEETTYFADGSSTTQNFAAAYAVVAEPGGSGQFQLERWRCAGGSVVEHQTVVRDLADANAVTANASSGTISLTVSQADGDETYDFAVGGKAGARVG